MRFVRAHPDKNYKVLTALHVEYFNWVAERVATNYGLAFVDLIGLPLDKMVDRMIRGLGREDSVFYLLEVGGETAGIGGVGNCGDGAAEMIRVYVKPEFRGAGLGDRLVERLIADARKMGFTKLLLTSAQFMVSAHRIYEAQGFFERAPYDHMGVPPALVPHLRFMERAL